MRLWTIVLALAMSCAPAANAAGPVKQWQITPTSLIACGEPALQNIDLVIENADAVETSTLKVWSGETLLAETPLGSLKSGTNQVSVLLPEPSASRETRWVLGAGNVILAEQAVTWKPPRHWTIYEVFSSHVDIGLHDPQYKQRLMCS